MNNYICNVKLNKIFQVRVRAENSNRAKEVAEREILFQIKELLKTKNQDCFIVSLFSTDVHLEK